MPAEPDSSALLCDTSTYCDRDHASAHLTPELASLSRGTVSSNDMFSRQRFTNRSGGLALSCQRRPVNGKPESRWIAGRRLAPEANPHALGSRSLQATGELLKALASDL